MLVRSMASLARLLGVPSLSVAHSWYPSSCCGGADCEKVRDDAVEYTQGGWLVHITGEVIPFDRARPSPDGHFHRCRMRYDEPKSHTRCLFVPNPGV